jgi:hypothetical protein
MLYLSKGGTPLVTCIFQGGHQFNSTFTGIDCEVSWREFHAFNQYWVGLHPIADDQPMANDRLLSNH